jgi:hypothetical protein
MSSPIGIQMRNTGVSPWMNSFLDFKYDEGDLIGKEQEVPLSLLK